jgi:hypothetical protein
MLSIGFNSRIIPYNIDYHLVYTQGDSGSERLSPLNLSERLREVKYLLKVRKTAHRVLPLFSVLIAPLANVNRNKLEGSSKII